ncbi:MAG: hypothetical protein ACD_78C00123G0001, partial [uncultured bacterium (gcode 4)]
MEIILRRSLCFVCLDRRDRIADFYIELFNDFLIFIGGNLKLHFIDTFIGEYLTTDGRSIGITDDIPIPEVPGRVGKSSPTRRGRSSGIKEESLTSDGRREFNRVFIAYVLP